MQEVHPLLQEGTSNRVERNRSTHIVVLPAVDSLPFAPFFVSSMTWTCLLLWRMNIQAWALHVLFFETVVL